MNQESTRSMQGTPLERIQAFARGESFLVASDDIRTVCNDLTRLLLILHNRSDVKDGPEGRQLPNEAMSILMEFDAPTESGKGRDAVITCDGEIVAGKCEKCGATVPDIHAAQPTKGTTP